MSRDPDGSFARRAKIRAQNRFIEPISRGECCTAQDVNDNIPPHVRVVLFSSDLSSFLRPADFFHINPAIRMAIFNVSRRSRHWKEPSSDRNEREKEREFFIVIRVECLATESARILTDRHNAKSSASFRDIVIRYFFYSTFKTL